MKIDEVLEKITLARVSMLMRLPFFGQLSMLLEPKESSKIETVATNGKFFFYNRDYVAERSQDEIIFLYAHCILHCAYEHMGRRGLRDPAYWDAANDYIVNYTLKKLKIGAMPPDALFSDRYTDEMTTEEIYDLLIKETKNPGKSIDKHLEPSEDYERASKSEKSDSKDKNKKKSKNKKSDKSDTNENSEDGEKSDDESNEESDENSEGESQGDGTEDGDDNGTGSPGNSGEGDEQDTDGDPGDIEGMGENPNGLKDHEEIGNSKNDDMSFSEADLDEIRNKFQRAILEASQSNEGKLPGKLERMVTEFFDPKINWKELLSETFASHLRDDYTFNIPNRRSYALGVIMPSQTTKPSIEVAVSMDTSGSISDEIFTSFLSETMGILEQYEDFKLHIWCIDTEIYNYQVITPENMDDLASYKPFGGGGNDFPRNWDFMRENEIEPAVFVCFSDGYPVGPWCGPDDENYCENIFVIRNDWDKTIVAPIGKTVYFE